MTQEKKALWEERECEKRERAGKQGVKVGRFGEGRYRDVSRRGIAPYRFSSQCPWQQLVLHVLKGKSPVGGVIGEPGQPTVNILSVTHHQSLFVLRFPSQAHECHSMREWVWTWIHLRTTVLLGLVGHTVHNDCYISLTRWRENKEFSKCCGKGLMIRNKHDDTWWLFDELIGKWMMFPLQRPITAWIMSLLLWFVGCECVWQCVYEPARGLRKAYPGCSRTTT